ncbi:MAG: hypothetical protein ACRC0V_08050 [Fusobacteriaceae bacterium]
MEDCRIYYKNLGGEGYIGMFLFYYLHGIIKLIKNTMILDAFKTNLKKEIIFKV